jgi:hypothetical protein
LEIANPIYDVVFKYLMEDHQVAKIILSTLTKLEIISLELLPQELSVVKTKTDKTKHSILTGLNLSIYRLDFSAKILQADGTEKVIIIEIQKSKFAHENMRFRKYLGKQYMNESFFQWISDTQGKNYKMGLPILPIYFLGERIEGFDSVPVIMVNRTIRDRFTNKVIDERHNFIDALFHEGIIVNIPALKKKRRDELEMLLSVFDQDNRNQNHHIMNVTELDFPIKFRPIIRRLQQAAQVKEVRDIMIVEDDFLAELNDYEHRIAESEKQKLEERRQKQEAIKKQEEAILKQEEAVKLLLKMGMSKQEIAKSLGISLDYFDKI